MKCFTIHEFSQMVGKTPQTLRNWGRRGVLLPHHKGMNGYRCYSDEQLNQVLGVKQKDRIVGYCRVSSPKQKDDLERQIENVRMYLTDQFGVELCEYVAKLHGTEIEVIGNTEKIEEQELVDDLIQIVTVFSCRFQGKRANKVRKMIKELSSDD